MVIHTQVLGSCPFDNSRLKCLAEVPYAHLFQEQSQF